MKANVISLAFLILIINCSLIQGQRSGTKSGQRTRQQAVQRRIGAGGYGGPVRQQQAAQEEGPQFNQVDEEADAEPPVYGGVPGAQPGVDFPGYRSIQELPQTNFRCSDAPYPWGYYADQASQCQAFHICHDGTQVTMLCPVGTVFDQEMLTCNDWNKVDCSQAPNFYSANDELGRATGEPGPGGQVPSAPSRGAAPSAGRRPAAPAPRPAPRPVGPAPRPRPGIQAPEESDYEDVPPPAPRPPPRAAAPSRPSFTPQVNQDVDDEVYPAPQPQSKRPPRPRVIAQPARQSAFYGPPPARAAAARQTARRVPYQQAKVSRRSGSLALPSPAARAAATQKIEIAQLRSSRFRFDDEGSQQLRSRA